MKKIFFTVTLFIIFVSSQALVAAPIETFKFDSPQTEKTFHKLSDELRCLVCQNQNIAESNADLAKDLRLEIYNMLQEGQTEDEIVAFMVQRYGDYVLYRPPFKPMTWLLWIGPILIFAFGLTFVIRLLRSQAADKQQPDLSEKEIERIKALHAEQDVNKK